MSYKMKVRDYLEATTAFCCLLSGFAVALFWAVPMIGNEVPVFGKLLLGAELGFLLGAATYLAVCPAIEPIGSFIENKLTELKNKKAGKEQMSAGTESPEKSG